MKQNLNLVSYILLIIGFCCCKGRTTCANENLIFDQYHYSEREYKLELLRILEVEKNPRFYFSAYEKRADKVYIIVDVQAINLCAKAEMQITTMDNSLKQVIENKGLGYRGAELVGLQYSVQENQPELVYQNLYYILD